jgi:hypothetical protein
MYFQLIIFLVKNIMKKISHLGFKFPGIAPNLLIKQVENTAPWLFINEISTQEKNREYLKTLIQYKKNPKLFNSMDLTSYFELCLSAHWTTAGTFVPTDVDNQIREGLWRHEKVGSHLQKMARLTIQAWTWDYSQVTNRKSINPVNNQILSTHEGTWLSVAIGGYSALMKNKQYTLADELYHYILLEVEKEHHLLTELKERKDHLNFLRTCALMAHNFGDLDRVIEQWEMNLDDPKVYRIYKLGHRLNEHYSKIFVFSGQVNKAFLAQENHRHMSMRAPRGLRKSHHFLIPIGPFMEKWGETLSRSTQLTNIEKVEILASFLEGFSRQDHAFGYARAFHGFVQGCPDFMDVLEREMPIDLCRELKDSKFAKLALINQNDFEQSMKNKLNDFICPVTNITF